MGAFWIVDTSEEITVTAFLFDEITIAVRAVFHWFSVFHGWRDVSSWNLSSVMALWEIDTANKGAAIFLS